MAAGLGWQTWRQYQSFLYQPLSIPGSGSVFTVEPGLSGRAAVIQLQQQGLTRNSWQWRVLMRLEPPLLKVGEYRLEPGLTPQALLKALGSGDVVQYRFTIVEGWTFRQLQAALATDEILGPGFTAGPDDVLPDGIDSDWPHPEGQFLPETYVYTRADNAFDVLQRAHQALTEQLTEAWEGRIDGHPVNTPYELLILASIIEKETALEAERTLISGVFVRRLNTGMRLQTDPTVIYGLGESFDGDIRRRDLQTDTPYNTYTRHGLPPTPISLAGAASLQAAAQPAPGDALFFVANGQGGHTFSVTLEEHQRAVNKLIGRN